MSGVLQRCYPEQRATNAYEYPWKKAWLYTEGGNIHPPVGLFLEVIELKSLTSSSVIVVMKSIFSRHGPQYRSAEFASQYDFTHSTSSPYFLQSKSNAERTMKTVKKHLKELNDQSLSLLAYNVTPLPWCRTADGQAINFIQMSPR